MRLRLGHSIRIDGTGRVEDDSRRKGLRTGLHVSIGIALARHFFKHPIDCAHVKVHMLIETRKKVLKVDSDAGLDLVFDIVNA
jgi:hypothetical protein